MLDDSVALHDYLDESLRLAGRLADASRVGGIEALVVLNDAPLSLAGHIRAQWVVLYSGDEPARVRYESCVFRRYLDYRIHEEPRERVRLRTIASREG